MQNENRKTDIGEKLIEFIEKYRKAILVSIGILVVLFFGLVIFISLHGVFQKKAITEVEELSARFDELRFSMEDESKTADITILLADLEIFVKNKGGYPGSKAWSMIAQIYSGRKDWQNAKDAWLSATKTGNKTYLAPISLFNAAVAAEEQGNIDEAIELLEKCISHPFEFPAAPRAQFAIGRLYEKQDNYPAAIEAYRTVLANWQDVPVWQQLARSRITAITIR
jgi:tetratricopeptide (TPR) repeat protein